VHCFDFAKVVFTEPPASYTLQPTTTDPHRVTADVQDIPTKIPTNIVLEKTECR